MANSWNNQHFQPNQQPTNQIRFFDPSQFQAPAANPATLKYNQHQNPPAGQNNSNAGAVQHQPDHQSQYPGNAWGGGGASTNSMLTGGPVQDGQSSWTNWGSWDWNQDQQNVLTDQHSFQQHPQQQDQQFHYQQPPTSQPHQYQQYQQQQQQQPPANSESVNAGSGDAYTATGHHHQQPSNNTSWDPSGQYTQPENSQVQDMQYSQPHSASYFGGDSNVYGDQYQFLGFGGADQNQPQQQQQQFPGESGLTGNQDDEASAAMADTGQHHVEHLPESTTPQHETHQQVNSVASLDQGQSQVLYDQPSTPSQSEYNKLSSFSDNGPWLDNSQQQHPHFHHHQQDGMVGQQGFGIDEEGGKRDNNVGDNVTQGHDHHHHPHSHEPSLVSSNASPNLHQQLPDSFPSIPVIATNSPSHHHQHHQGPDSVSADASLNEYCDNDSDGGTVAGFFGRGDDDGDVSSDVQRSSNRSSNLNSTMNTSSGSDSATVTDGQAGGMFLNVAAAGKPIARENSEISNASLSTFNMSVDDAGKEHLNELQALVQRMENVDIANRQSAQQAATEKVDNQYEGSSSLQFDQQQQHGDFTGFGSDSISSTNPPPQPPPTLSLDTNAVADRPVSPDGGNAASSESGGSGASGTSSGLTDWEIVPSQSQMTHSRNSSLDNNVTTFVDKPDGSINNESVRDGSSSNKDGGMDENSVSASSTSQQQQPPQSFNSSNTINSGNSGAVSNHNSSSNSRNMAHHFQNVPPSSVHSSSHNEEHLSLDNLSLSSPPQAQMTTVFAPTTSTALSSVSQQHQHLSPEGPLSFQPSKSPKLGTSNSSVDRNRSGGNMPLPQTSGNTASYFNPPPPVSNSDSCPVPSIPTPTLSSGPVSIQQMAKSSISQPPPSSSPRLKKASEDGAPPLDNRKTDSSERPTAIASSSSTYSSNSEQKFRRPRDPGMRREGDNPAEQSKVPISSSSQRRHQSAFHPIHRPRQNTVSPATTLWDTDSRSSSNILLAPAMPLIIPALNPYSSSAAATATTETATSIASSSVSATNSVSKSSSLSMTAESRSKGPAKELEEQTPRSRYGDRRGEKERGREDRHRDRDRDRERDREDTNRSFDSLDELDSGPDYRTPRDKPYKSDRPESRSDRRYDYDYPSARGDRPMSRTEGGSYRDDPHYRRNRGGYYADSYYDEHYDRPRSRHDEAAKNSRPSSRSGGQEVDRPGSRGGEYDRERDYGYRDRNRGYYYDGYSRNDYYNEDRERYYRSYYRDRDARYSRGYYEEYYGKNADYYLQQHQQQQQQQQRQARPGSRSHESDGTGSRSNSQSRSRSQSRGNTPGLEQQQSDYYNRGSRPDSRMDYARDYYRGYAGYDYAGYYDGYGYDPYSGYGYTGYADTASQGYDQGRMTPPKYAYPHIRACFGPNGQLIKVLPNRPADGQPALVELVEVQTVLETCQEAEDLKQFPGPLSREGTHKKDVLLFCQRKAIECMEDVDMVDRESAQLIWKLLELLIKQNGSVVGTDLSDLLLDGHEPSAVQYSTAGVRASSRQSADGLEMMTEDSLEGDGSSRNSPALAMVSGGVRSTVSMDRTAITPSRQREDYIARFRHLLLYGRKKDAIECAMKYNLWGHALFLASKMDTRTHASVMIRFANSAMRMNDPLQTLYQLMSGRQPASATCVVDERWGDWRPHLAMILSNQTARPDLDRKSITTLGDTLAAKGCLHASHFCYLMAQVPFGTYDKKTSKIVLVGANHYLPLKEFASMEAIQCTEIYEYSQTLSNPVFCLPHFQLYKYLYACRLVDFGLVTEAFMYCEVMASAVCRYPAFFQPSFVHLVHELASKLKYSDPQRQNSHVDDHVDPVWIQQLQGLLPQYADGTIQPVSGTITPSDLRSSVDNNGGGGGGDARLYQHQYQQQQQQAQSNVTDTTNDYGQGSGEIAPQESNSAGFDTQAYQYSQPQPGQGDYTTGQYYQQDAALTNQSQQQYPGYDETDSAAVHHQQQQPQQDQQQQHYPDYSTTTTTDASQSHHTGYDNQQQHDYNQWQQQQQQYAGYNYMGYGLDTHQHQQTDGQESSSLLSSSSSTTTSTPVLPPPPPSSSSSFAAPQQLPPTASSLDMRRSSYDQNHHHLHHHLHHGDDGSHNIHPHPPPHHLHHNHHQLPPPLPHHQQHQSLVEEDTGNQMDLTSSQASSAFSGASSGFGSHSGSGSMAMPPRASITTNETEDDDDEDDDDDDVDDEQGGAVTGFDYFGNASQRVVVPPNRFRTPSESSAAGGRRRRTTSGSSTGSVKASPHKPAQSSTSSTAMTGKSSSAGPGGDLKDGPGNGGGSGWFGGLFSKFGRKGKNEMILPDDKDPAIVWDDKRKKWVNADGTEEEVAVAAPPPKDIDLMSGKSSGSSAPPPSIPGGPAGPGMPPPPSGGPSGANKFSLKAKGGRNQYVDVNNPKPVTAPQGLFNLGPTMGNGAPVGTVPQVFLPGSTATSVPSTSSTSHDNNNSNNLLTVPGPTSTGDDLSRSCSSSSVNLEVQRLTGQVAQDSSNSTSSTQQQQQQQPSAASTAVSASTNAMPMLFNPATLNTGASTGSAPAGPGLKYGQRRAYPKK